MPGKINVYNLGTKGVNTVKSPVHLEDGELTKAQNSQIDSVGGAGGIRKRDGLTRLTGSALAGAARGLIAPRLPDRTTYTRTFYAAYQGATNHWWKSTDGATWAVSTDAAKPQQDAQWPTTERIYLGRMCTHRDRLYFPGEDDAAGRPTIRVFDGTETSILCSIPQNPRESSLAAVVHSIVSYSDDFLLVGVGDNATQDRGRVLLLQISNGQLTQLGPETDLAGFPCAIIVALGRVWAGIQDTANPPFLHWIRPGDSTWSASETLGADTGDILSFAVFKGLLYAAVANGAGTSADIYRRAADNSWGVVESGDGTSAGNYMGPLIVSQDGETLYSGWYSGNGASPEARILSSTDGTTFTQVHSVTGSFASSSEIAHPYMDPSTGNIYWPIGGKGIIRDVAGVFSVVLTDATVRGPMTSILIAP